MKNFYERTGFSIFSRFLLAVVLVVGVAGSGWGQTNPTPHDLSTSNYTFTGFADGSTTTYPTSMQGWRFGSEPGSTFVGPATGDRDLANSGTAIGTGSIRNEVANGISLLNSGSNHIGAIAVSLNTIGRDDIKVTWTAQQLNSGGSGATDRINGLQLQYRVGTSGDFTTVAGTEYLTTNTTEQNPEQTFTNIALPTACDNQPVVQIRWIYYISSGTANARDRIRLDNITISSEELSAQVVDNPTNFEAIAEFAAGDHNINLSWDLNTDDDNVLLAWSGDGVFGAEPDTQTPGGTITGGGMVLYFGDNTSFAHEGLDANTIYHYRIWSFDGTDYSPGVTINETTYPDPSITELPYEESFDTDLGECYVYSVEGDQHWDWNSNGNPGGSAQMSGFSGGALANEDWLITPAIDFTGLTLINFVFDEMINHETTNGMDAEQEVYISTEYAGVGDPSAVSWTKLPLTSRASGSSWDFVTVDEIDLSGYADESSVHIAFKYTSTTDGAATWRIDNIHIFDATQPSLAVEPESLSDLNYIEGEGPSLAQSFQLSGENLDDSDVTITAPASFEVSDAEEGVYGEDLSLTAYDGGAKTIWVRLNSGLDVGTYSGEIEISGGGADPITVAVSGDVVPDGYFVNFEGDGETQLGYASATVNLSGLDWDMTEALIGTDAADWKNGQRSARMRGYGTSAMTMLEPKEDGIGTISFQYRRYGSDAQVDWKVEYSTADKSSWIQIGDDFTAPASDDVQTFSEEVNVGGDIYVRIVRATAEGSANRRLNIDDILITDYEAPVVPTLSVDPTSLTGLNYFLDGGPSTEKTFTITGENFDNEDVTITAPDDFEIRLAAIKSTFSSSLTIENYDGDATDIFVRLKSDLPVGAYSGDVTINFAGDRGDVDATVTVSGNVFLPFDLPYANAFRTVDDFNNAVDQGFVMVDAEQRTGAGGYLLIEKKDGYLESPVIDFTDYEALFVKFDVATFGSGSDRKLSIKAMKNDSSYETIKEVDVTATTPNYYSVLTVIELNGDFNHADGQLRFEMTDGTGGIRFRDFEIKKVENVFNISELRINDEESDVIYRLTSEVILTYQQDFRNQKFVQDKELDLPPKVGGVAGILIDDVAGVISTTYDLYDGIENLTGYLDRYEEMLVLVPIFDPGDASSNDNVVIPSTADLTNLDEYEAVLVELKDVEFVFPDKQSIPLFEFNQSYMLSDGTNTVEFRTVFEDADYIGKPIPEGQRDIVGFPLTDPNGGEKEGSGFYFVSRIIEDLGDLDPILYTTDVPDGGIVGLNYFIGEGPSDPKSFTLVGAYFDGVEHIFIEAPDNFEVSFDDPTKEVFQDMLEIEYYHGDPVEILVRLKAGLAAGDYEGEIEINRLLKSGGTTVGVSGGVSSPTAIPIAPWAIFLPVIMMLAFVVRRLRKKTA